MQMQMDPNGMDEQQMHQMQMSEEEMQFHMQ